MLADDRASITYGTLAGKMKHEFCDHCPGCRPALFNVTTGQKLPANSLIMIAINQIWNTQSSYAERKAFINVTLHNSRAAEDLALAQALMQRVADAIKEAGG